jgi:hypothetical protein
MHEAMVRSMRAAVEPVVHLLHRHDGELGQIRQTVERTSAAVDDLAGRLSRFEQRRKITEATAREGIAVVRRYYRGLCPCCQDTEILSDGKPLPGVFEAEHFFSPAKNRSHEVWFTCKDCNRKLRDDGRFRRDADVRFKTYQNNRERFRESAAPVLPFEQCR